MWLTLILERENTGQVNLLRVTLLIIRQHSLAPAWPEKCILSFSSNDDIENKSWPADYYCQHTDIAGEAPVAPDQRQNTNSRRQRRAALAGRA